MFKNIDFWGSYATFRFYRFTRTLTRIYENRSGYLSEKSCKFWSKAARVLKFWHSMPNMIHLKVTNYWGSRKLFSVCKNENATYGAKLHHHPRDRGKQRITKSFKQIVKSTILGKIGLNIVILSKIVNTCSKYIFLRLSNFTWKQVTRLFFRGVNPTSHGRFWATPYRGGGHKVPPLFFGYVLIILKRRNFQRWSIIVKWGSMQKIRTIMSAFWGLWRHKCLKQ